MGCVMYSLFFIVVITYCLIYRVSFLSFKDIGYAGEYERSKTDTAGISVVVLVWFPSLYN